MTQQYFTRGFKLLLLTTSVTFLLTLCLVANNAYSIGITPEGAAQAENTRQAIEQQRQTITAASIFVNNVSVSIILLLPFLGFFAFLGVLINTGNVIGLLAAAYNAPPLMYVANILVIGGWLEILAYSFLAAESMYLIFLAITQSGAVQRVKTHIWKTLLIYFALLAIGAVWEAFLLA